MAIKMNAGYNSPEIAAVAQNIANMFGPPSAGELAGYSTARKNNQEVDHKARLAQIALDPNSDWTQIDRAGLGLGGWVPTQSLEGIDRNNAAQRYGYDTQAATARENNLRDNQTKLAERFAGPANPTYSSLGLSLELADHFGMPEIAVRAGTPTPLSETQWRAQQGQRLLDAETITDADLVSVITRDGNGSAAQQKIARLADQLMATGTVGDPKIAYEIAVGIEDGRYRYSRDPITGEGSTFDMVTGRDGPLVSPGRDDAYPPVDPVIDAITRPDTPKFGQQYPASKESFGVGGALAGGINTVLDAVGIGAPYKDIQQTQADFGVLRESILNDLSSAYGRQPPSWLMKRIDALTPAAGNPLEGPEGAVSKLTSIGWQLENELHLAQEALQRPLTPSNKQEAEAKIAGLQAGIDRVSAALASFPSDSGAPPVADDVPEGIDPADWQYMTDDERALFR